MKKILFLLLCVATSYGQIVPTGQETSFDYGIQNTSSQLDDNATYITVQTTDGVQGKSNSSTWAKKIYVDNADVKKAFLSTGLIKNGLVTTNADPTKFNITAGIGIISNFDDPENPTSTIVNFPAFTGITPTYLLTGNITYVAINSVPSVVMQATPFTNIQRRDLIALGAVIHSNLTTINLVNNISAPINADTNQIHDFMEAIGALNVSGNKYSANGANLSLNKSAGAIFKLGVNFANNWKDPHNLTIASGMALTFRYRTQNGTEGLDITSLDPSVYDLNNVLTAVPVNRFSIQTVTLFQTGQTRIQYGQTTYATMAEAEAAIITRAYVVEPNIAANGIARAYIILRHNATDLTNATTSKIIEAQKFGGVASGGVAVTLDAIIAALGYTPANDVDVVKLSGIQSLTGLKTLDNGELRFKSLTTAGLNSIYFSDDEFSTKLISDTNASFAVKAGYFNLLNSAKTYFTTFQNPNLTGNVTIETPTESGKLALTSNLSSYQPLLVSGTNIKTINGNSVLGSGDLAISGGSSKFMNATGFDGYGDSITLGMNSSPTSNSYINLLGSLYSKTIVNRAASARGIWEASRQFFANVSTLTTTMPIVMAGFNDVRRGGSSVKTTAKIINGYKSIIANQFLNSFTGANSTTNITKSGTWTQYAGISVGAKTDNGSYSNGNGSYIEYTFTDNNVVLGLVAGDGVGQIHADFTVTIDGVSQGSFTENNQTDGISDGVNDNARSTMCLLFSGLSDGTHVVRLTNTTTSNLIVDYFGHLKQPKFCTPILIMQAPKMDATGYATSPNLANDVIIDQLNSNLVSLVATFPSEYPIVIAKTNDFYNVTTGLDTSDHIHPNNIGHRQIYTATYTALNSLLFNNSISAGVSLSANNTWTGLNIFTQQLKTNQGFQVQGAGTGLTGEGAEIEHYAGISYFSSYNRTTSAWKPMVLRASDFTFGGVKITSANRVLIGATDNGADALQVSGGVYASGAVQVGQGLVVRGSVGSPAGAGIELEYNAGASYFTSYNRTTSSWLPTIIRASNTSFFASGTEIFKILSSGNAIIQGGGAFTDSGDRLQVVGTLKVTGVLKAGDVLRLKNYTVATLPAGTQGDTAYITDATAPTYLGTLTGGGSVVCPVFYNGTAWVSH